VDDVKRLILSCCPATWPAGRATHDLPDEFDLRAEGVVDSLGFIELISEIEARLGCQIDFDGLEPELMTRIGPLARYIADRAA
jgi:acyl carrier protein